MVLMKSGGMIMKLSNDFWRGVTIGGVVTLVTTLFATMLVQNCFTLKYKDIRKLNLLTYIIEKNYKGDYEKDTTFADEMYKGLFDHLDMYSVYYSKDEYKEMTEPNDYVGIGVRCAKNTYSNKLMVIEVMKGSPAEQAGVKHGDVIYKVDDIVTYDKKLDELTDKMRGKEGTQVVLTIIRGDTNN